MRRFIGLIEVAVRTWRALLQVLYWKLVGKSTFNELAMDVVQILRIGWLLGKQSLRWHSEEQGKS